MCVNCTPWRLILVCEGRALTCDNNLLVKFCLGGFGMGTCYLEGARDVHLSHHRCCRAFDFSTVSGFNLDGSTQQDAFIASWLQVTLLRAWASTSKRRSREVEGEFHQVCEFVWACLETATKAEGAAGETGRRRSRPRQSQFGIVRKMQYFLHVWDFVLVDFFGSSMTHGFYCVLSTVWGWR